MKESNTPQNTRQNNQSPRKASHACSTNESKSSPKKESTPCSTIGSKSPPKKASNAPQKKAPLPCSTIDSSPKKASNPPPTKTPNPPPKWASKPPPEMAANPPKAFNCDDYVTKTEDKPIVIDTKVDIKVEEEEAGPRRCVDDGISPPHFDDFGKRTRDILMKSYCYGFLKLNAFSSPLADLDLKAKGQINMDMRRISGQAKAKYHLKDIGTTMTGKFHTDNLLTGQITIENTLYPGLTATLETQYAPRTGKKSAKVLSYFKNQLFNVGLDADLRAIGPEIQLPCSFGFKGFLIGYKPTFDFDVLRFTKHAFRLGYTKDHCDLFSHIIHCGDSTDFGASVYTKQDSTNVGVSLSWSSHDCATRFAIGATHTIDDLSSVAAKINNSGQFGLNYTVAIREGIKMTLSSLVNLLHLSQGNYHKLGFCLDFEG